MNLKMNSPWFRSAHHQGDQERKMAFALAVENTPGVAICMACPGRAGLCPEDKPGSCCSRRPKEVGGGGGGAAWGCQTQVVCSSQQRLGKVTGAKGPA